MKKSDFYVDTNLKAIVEGQLSTKYSLKKALEHIYVYLYYIL